MSRILDPRIRVIVERWPDETRYEFEERAAILEFEGGESRFMAERHAYEQTRPEKN